MSIEPILRRQGGVISRRQAIAAGLLSGAVDDRVRRRRWRPLHPQVYLVAAGPVDAEVKVRAALLWAGEGAVLAGAAAAWWFGWLARPPTTLTIAGPRHPPPARPGIVLRQRELAPADLTEHRGIGLTARPLTVLETAVELDGAGAALLDGALQSWLPFRALHDACLRNPSRRGRRALAATIERSTTVTRRRLVRLLRDSGTTGWHGAAGPVGGAAVTFPGPRVSIEVTGFAPALDEQPRLRPAGSGWTTLGVGWSDLADRPLDVLAEIAGAVRPPPAR